MSFSSPFIRRPVATTLLTIGLFLAGALAYPLLPVSPLPQVDFPTISVQANLPGASPETMATLGRHAARATVRPHRGRDRDDIDELPRRLEHRAAVRSEPEHRRR